MGTYKSISLDWWTVEGEIKNKKIEKRRSTIV